MRLCCKLEGRKITCFNVRALLLVSGIKVIQNIRAMCIVDRNPRCRVCLVRHSLTIVDEISGFHGGV